LNEQQLHELTEEKLPVRLEFADVVDDWGVQVFAAKRGLDPPL